MKKGFIHRLIIAKLVPFLSRHPYVVFFFGLIYLIVPIDLIPEALTGFLGYFDDLLMFVIPTLLLNKFRKEQQAKNPSMKGKKSPYEVLGIKPFSSQMEIQKAYRKKMAEYHPDKVAHLGRDLQKTALEKTKEIQEAYEALTKR